MMRRQPHLDDLLPYLMNRLVARLNQNLGETLRRHGHTFQDWRILAVLAAHDGINVTQLMDAAVLPQPTVSRLVAGLRRRGLIARRTASADSRIVQISLTPKGMRAYRKMLPHAVAEYRAAMKGLTAQDDAYLRAILQRMMKNRGVALLPHGQTGRAPVKSAGRI